MFRNLPPVTRNIIIINIIAYIATRINPSVMYGFFALYPPASHDFHVWQIVTHMFLHGSFSHIFFNMYALMVFGSVLENIIGSKKFLTFYMVSGIGAAALYLGVQALTFQYHLCVGASGAIYGVLLGYAMMFPDSVLTLFFPPVSMKAKWMVLIFVAIELGIGVLGVNDGVAHFAHLGGMLVGFIMMFIWKKTHRLFDKDIWI